MKTSARLEKIGKLWTELERAQRPGETWNPDRAEKIREKISKIEKTLTTQERAIGGFDEE